MALGDDEMQTVGEREFRDLLLKFFKILSCQQERQQKDSDVT
jgi:hypothetical protein